MGWSVKQIIESTQVIQKKKKRQGSQKELFLFPPRHHIKLKHTHTRPAGDVNHQGCQLKLCCSERGLLYSSALTTCEKCRLPGPAQTNTVWMCILTRSQVHLAWTKALNQSAPEWMYLFSPKDTSECDIRRKKKPKEPALCTMQGPVSPLRVLLKKAVTTSEEGNLLLLSATWKPCFPSARVWTGTSQIYPILHSC